jgi:TP901-1 family phage major tail protein
MPIKLGMEAKLLYKVGGQEGGGAWTELTNVKDVTLSLEAGEADVTTRANSGWRATVATLKEASVEFEMVWDTTDAGFGAVKDAYLNNAPIGLQVLDGATGQGLQADFMITSFSRSEPLEEAITVSVTAKVTYSATPPSWLEGT